MSSSTDKKKLDTNSLGIKIVKCVFAFFFPVVLCAIYCLLRRVSFADLYLPSSSNNDTLFYYKLVESMSKIGISRGYFGFNESHAIYGSFAAWSPLIILPWTLFGLIFGWGYSSVFISNILFFSIALTLFVLLTDIDFRNLLFLFLLFLMFPSLPIHMLNALPETCIVSVTLIYLALAIRLCRREYKTAYSVLLCVLALYLTLLRPYMILFFLIPLYFGIKEKKKVSIVLPIILGVCSLILYFVIGYFFTGEYFTPLFDLSIVKMILQGRIVEAFWSSVYVFKGMIKGISEYIAGAFSYGLTAGTQYVLFILVFVASSFLVFDKKEKKMRIVYSLLSVFSFALIFAIIFFLQKTNEGGRHVWVIAIAGLAVIACSNWNVKNTIIKSVIALFLLAFIFRGSLVPTDYDIPIKNIDTQKNVEEWETIFAEKNLSANDKDGYDNTLIWVFIDYDDTTQVVTDYSELFALPKGMGISCCYPDYVIENIDNLKSKYLITYSGGKVDLLCGENEKEELARNRNVVLYQLHRYLN